MNYSTVLALRQTVDALADITSAHERMCDKVEVLENEIAELKMKLKDHASLCEYKEKIEMALDITIHSDMDDAVHAIKFKAELLDELENRNSDLNKRHKVNMDRIAELEKSRGCSVPCDQVYYWKDKYTQLHLKYRRLRAAINKCLYMPRSKTHAKAFLKAFDEKERERK